MPDSVVSGHSAVSVVGRLGRGSCKDTLTECLQYLASGRPTLAPLGRVAGKCFHCEFRLFKLCKSAVVLTPKTFKKPVFVWISFARFVFFIATLGPCCDAACGRPSEYLPHRRTHWGGNCESVPPYVTPMVGDAGSPCRHWTPP